MHTDFVKNKSRSIVKLLINAAFFGNLVSLLLLAACSMLLWRGDIPEGISNDLVLGAAFAGSITAGLIASSGEGKGAISGILGGLSYLVIVAAIGMYREQTSYFDLNFLKLVICAAAGSIFGGIISTGKKPKKRKKRHTRYTNSNQ